MEFAFVALPFLFLLLGTIELGRYFFTQQNLRTLAAESARAAMINSANVGCPPSNAVMATINQKTPFLNSSGLTVCITPATDSAGRKTINVTASYAFTTPVPFVSFLNGTVSDSTRLIYSPN